MSGSPPGILTTGTPHSSTALKHSSGVNWRFRTCPGYWILPHPAHARLQRRSGSSISTSGYFFCPRIFLPRTYEATVHICEIGTPKVLIPPELSARRRVRRYPRSIRHRAFTLPTFHSLLTQFGPVPMHRLVHRLWRSTRVAVQIHPSRPPLRA